MIGTAPQLELELEADSGLFSGTSGATADGTQDYLEGENQEPT